MKHLKRLALSFTLMAALSVAGSAGETAAPPCAPGETAAPPCAAQSVNDAPLVPGEMSTPPDQPMVDVSDITDAVMWALSLF
jgi:hypothetical protein